MSSISTVTVKNFKSYGSGTKRYLLFTCYVAKVRE